MKTLKEDLQARTKASRTLEAVVAGIFKDMIFTAEQGGDFVIWRENEEYYPGVQVVKVITALNQELTKNNSGLFAELKDNQEQIKLRLERRAGSVNFKNAPVPELRQWIVVSWGD